MKGKREKEGGEGQGEPFCRQRVCEEGSEIKEEERSRRPLKCLL